MISVESAHKLILDHSKALETEDCSLEKLIGRTLGESLYATRNHPSFDRVCMDGIAIGFKALEKTRSFDIHSIQKAGEKPHELKEELGCIEVMTGASLPLGTDTVVPYEKIKINEGTAVLKEGYEVRPRQNIHFKAHDYGEGNLLLSSGIKLTSAHVSLIAGQGITSLKVFKSPRVAVIATGDELTLPGQSIEDWQVYSSNVYGIKAELNSFGVADVEVIHLKDDREEILSGIQAAINKFDLVVLSGGVSAGKFDFVDKVMSDLRIQVHFHKISQKPGKPMLFGTTEDGKSIFGLPGNPNAALICLRRYIISALFLSNPKRIAVEKVKIKEGFTSFLPIKDGKVVEGNGSGDFYSLSKSDGFIEVHKIADTYDYFPWGHL